MNDDRALLESAAKAAGIETLGRTFDYRRGYWMPPNAWWNPLTDDGDALRLAVKLHLTLRCYMGSAVAQATVPGGPAVYIEETNHDDHAAATRRAITRAAAAIGEAMP